MDPMDELPTDYGSDRYDYIELIGKPDDVPLPGWLTDDWMPCPDCRANAFIKYIQCRPPDPDNYRWHVTVAHEDTCPTLARIESEDA